MKLYALYAYFDPERAASSYIWDNLHEAFAKNGIITEISTPIPTRGVSSEIRESFKSNLVESRYNGALVIRRFVLMKEGRNPFLRAWRYFVGCLRQYRLSLKSPFAMGADVLFSVSTPPIQGAMTALLKKKLGVPFVYCLQDIFPDSLSGTGLAKRGGLLWRIGRRIEDFTYRNADKIIVISEDFKKNIMAKGVPEDKISVVYNWVDSNIITPIEKEDNPLFEEFGLDRKMFTLVYAGNLGNAQNIGIILDVAARLPEVQIAIFGSGGVEGDVRRRILNEHLLNVHLNPLQPINRVSQVYSLGDACIVSCKRGLGGCAMPSKTWTIMSCARPVVASFDEGELKEIVEANSCGVFSHADNIDEFVFAIEGIVNCPEKCKMMGVNARHFIIENLTKEAGVNKYVDVITKTCQR